MFTNIQEAKKCVPVKEKGPLNPALTEQIFVSRFFQLYLRNVEVTI